MRTNLLSKSDTAKLCDKVEAQWGTQKIERAKNARVYYLDGASLLEIGDVRVLDIDGFFVPFLGSEDLLAKFPSITVDMGAVKFMCNGANVMRPGIKEGTEFEKDGIVCIVEESQRKCLAVGRALVSSAEMEKMERGETIKNLHYISDKHWEMVKEITP